MLTRTLRILSFILLFAGVIPAHAGAIAQLGVGVHYWTMLDDIDIDEIDSDGLAWYLSARMIPDSIVSFDLELERFPDSYAAAGEDVYAPAAYLVVGNSLYAALGIGGYYTDGEFSRDPFYALRAGVTLELLPKLFLDINANYRFNNWDDIKTVDEDIGSDTITLGAAARVEF